MVDGANLYGLGERVAPLLLNSTDGNYAMWTRDQGAAIADTNLYGAHPFYLQLLPSGSR